MARPVASAGSIKNMDLSVVIPVKNEAGNIAPLVAEITAAFDALVDYEIVYVDDGSTDATAAEIRDLQDSIPRLRLVRHARSCGQSAAIRSGVKMARGLWIATLDGDGQNDPADIPALWRIAQDAPAIPPLLIAGQRTRRQDSWSKRRASRIANAVRRRLLQDHTPDTGSAARCSSTCRISTTCTASCRRWCCVRAASSGRCRSITGRGSTACRITACSTGLGSA